MYREIISRPRSGGVHARDDGHAGMRLELKQVIVVRNNDVRLAGHGAFKNPVIVRVGYDYTEWRARCDETVSRDVGDATK